MKSVINCFLLLTVFTLAACANQAGPEADVKPVLFKKGTYRKDGKCISLVQDKTDMTPVCNAYIGVIAMEDDRPRFTFSQQNGDFWAFTTSGPATYSDGNRITIYPVSHIYQMSSKRTMLYEGECKLTKNEPYEDIDCITWKDKKRLQEAWKASFVGTGVWRYRPNQGEK